MAYPGAGQVIKCAASLNGTTTQAVGRSVQHMGCTVHRDEVRLEAEQRGSIECCAATADNCIHNRLHILGSLLEPQEGKKAPLILPPRGYTCYEHVIHLRHSMRASLHKRTAGYSMEQE